MAPPDLRPRETVILASDFQALMAWYRDVIGMTVTNLWEQEGMHYCNLESPGGIRIGIALASEMKVEPGDRSRNTVILQFEADDVQEFLALVEKHGATVDHGPIYNEKHDFWAGAFCDPEGNPCWVVDANCP
ncbi:MAG: hypothetical protein D8M59_00905 [Planctomycetes bacterium]|nr:hypothetical protein [Planctomycetota bacterium]NOG54721.1 hypothetical protein [Planctomycetota bacterium]